MTKQSLFDKILNFWGYIKEVNISTGQSFGLPIFAGAKTRQYLAAYKSWVYACVKARATDVSRIKLHLYKTINRKTGEVEEVNEHEVLSLLRKVNTWTSTRELFYQYQAYKDLAGESFWYLVRSKNQKEIMEIWPLRPDWMSVIPSAEKMVAGYEYNVPGHDKITLTTEEVIHSKKFNPLNPHRGLSIVQAAALTLDADEFAEQYNRNFFENGAVPSIVLETENKLDETIINRLYASWENRFKGKENAHKLAILEGGLKLNPFSMSQKDMEFLAGQAYTRDKILALFQTPKTVLGMTEGVTVSNAEATDLVFSQRVVKPAMEDIVDMLNEFLLPLYADGQDLFFGFDDPVEENQLTTNERYKTLFGLGAMTPNEIRALEGLDEVEGLDNFYLPINMVPISGESGDPAIDEEDAKSVINLSRFKKAKIIKNIPALNMRDRITEKITKDVTNKLAPVLSKYIKKSEIERTGENLGKCSWSEEKQELFWKKYVLKAVNFENKFKGTIREIFNNQEKEVTENLKQAAKAINQRDIDKILFSVTAQNKVSAQILVPIIREYLEQAGEDAFDELGIDSFAFNIDHPGIKNYLRDSALRGIKNMNAVTKRRLRVALTRALAQGDSVVELSKAVRNVFIEADKVRAEKIARTEIAKAGNAATQEAYKQSGVVVGKQWFTGLDERVCQWCAPMHEKVISIEGDFFNQGESLIGKDGGKLNFDLENVNFPPLHPNCRCGLLPVTISERSPRPNIVREKDTKSNNDVNVEEIVAKAVKAATDVVEKKSKELEKTVSDTIDKAIKE